MARQIRNAKLDTPTARSALKVRREPYWTIVSAGCAVGYRRLAVGRGTWIAKFRDPATGQRAYEALGAADDARDADGVSVFSFAQAQVKARAFFVRAARHAAGDELSVGGPFTVAMALEEYFAARLRKGSKSAAGDRKSTDAAVLPVLGDVPVAK